MSTSSCTVDGLSTSRATLASMIILAAFGPAGCSGDSSAGAIYVVDTLNTTIRKVTTAGVLSTFVRRAGVSGATTGALPAALTAPKGIAVDAAGNIYTATENAILTVAK
jgi:sugar lactone lactonase YvrE